MSRRIFASFVIMIVVGFAAPAFADIVRLKNGREIKAPKVIDKHGLFGPADESPQVIPENKVRLIWENGYMDIPAKEIKELKRE